MFHLFLYFAQLHYFSESLKVTCNQTSGNHILRRDTTLLNREYYHCTYEGRKLLTMDNLHPLSEKAQANVLYQMNYFRKQVRAKTSKSGILEIIPKDKYPQTLYKLVK